MKFFVLLLVILAGVWWIRQQRHNTLNQNTPNNAANTPQTMLPCKHCGIHVPENDALRGTTGVCCSPAHRQAAEG
jgi:uncharacterized protein